MNCELYIEKKDFENTKVLLAAYIERNFTLNINLKVDKIYVEDVKKNRVIVKQNDLEELKDDLPNLIKVIVHKESVADNPFDKNDSNGDNYRRLQDVIDGKDIDNNIFQSVNFAAMNANKQQPNQPQQNKQQAYDFKFEIDAFNYLLTYITDNTYNIPSNFDSLMIPKPYSQFYYKSLQAIQQSKFMFSEFVDKLKKMEAYVSELERQLKGNYGGQVNTGEINLLIQKYKNTFASDVNNEYYVPIAVGGKEYEYLTNFYNELVFLTKNNLMSELKAVREFFDKNQGLVNMILGSSGYSKGRNLEAIDQTKLDGKDLKSRCDEFTKFMSNLYQLLD